MVRHRPQRAACIRCTAHADTSNMLPLYSTRDADETAAIFIHAACAQTFVIDQLQCVARAIADAQGAETTGVTDLGKVRALKKLEAFVDRSLDTLEAKDWSP